MCVNFEGSFLVINILNLCPQSKFLKMALSVISVGVPSPPRPSSTDKKLSIIPGRKSGSTGVGRVWQEIMERGDGLFPDEYDLLEEVGHEGRVFLVEGTIYSKARR